LIADASCFRPKQVSLETSDAGHKPARTLLRVPRHREEETYPDDPGSDEERLSSFCSERSGPDHAYQPWAGLTALSPDMFEAITGL
jgi:hypothetical protein